MSPDVLKIEVRRVTTEQRNIWSMRVMFDDQVWRQRVFSVAAFPQVEDVVTHAFVTAPTHPLCWPEEVPA